MEKLKGIENVIDVSDWHPLDNFEFLKANFPDFYEKVHELEGTIRTSTSQDMFRNVLEQFFNIVFKKTYGQIPDWNINKKFIFLIQKKDLSPLPMVDSKENGLKFLYEFINEESVTFKKVYVAMALFHRLVQKTLGYEAGAYSLLKIPVQEYQICQCRKIQNKEYTEELFVRFKSDTYAIVRHYKDFKFKKATMEKSCFPRNLIQLKSNYYKVKTSRVVFVENSKSSNFYVIYEYSKEALKLTNFQNLNQPWETKDNFAFLKQKNLECYKKIHSAENYARISYLHSSDDIRNCLEVYVKNHIEEALKHKKNLRYYRRIHGNNGSYLKKKEMTFYNFSQAALIDRIACALKNDLITPSFDVSYIGWDNKIWTGDVYKFLRSMGNISTHDGVIKIKDDDPKLCRENIELGLKSMHDILMYPQKGEFDVGKIPIGDYEIFKDDVPEDAAYSNCIHEYFAVKYEDENHLYKKYAIVREYNIRDVDESLFREIDTFHSIYHMNLDRTPIGIPNVKAVRVTENENINYRYVAYEFDRVPVPLSSEFLTTLHTKKDALRICYRIASIFDTLHEKHIYHRMFTFDSVAICDYENYGMIPFIKNFNYSKLHTNDSLNTVVMSWQQANYRMRNSQYYYKYLIDQGNLHLWDKVDIYCMGILFGDILSFTIQKNKYSEKVLKELGYSEGILTLLQKMTMQDEINRPSAKDVRFAIKKEMNLL